MELQWKNLNWAHFFFFPVCLAGEIETELVILLSIHYNITIKYITYFSNNNK